MIIKTLAASTIFLSSFLMFSIQMMVSKFLLPYFGGSASVWNTSMMFFQTLLLGGYIYTHLICSCTTLKKQIWLHSATALFALFTLIKASAFDLSALPSSTNNPILSQVTVMLYLIGLPFFVISATAPLIQKWYVQSSLAPSNNIYILYAVSNLGAMGALLAYPLFLEGLIPLDTQKTVWTIGFGVFVSFLTGYGLAIYAIGKPIDSSNDDSPFLLFPPRLNLYQTTSYILLSFFPSVLILAVTTKITMDIASIPLLWAIPLTIYLLSFIFAFSERDFPWAKTPLALFLPLMTFALLDLHSNLRHSFWNLAVALLAFGILCYACHRRLYETRPDPKHLTRYYLLISMGGALGGLCGALCVPLIFKIPVEFPFFLSATLILLFYRRTTKLNPLNLILEWYHLPLFQQLTTLLCIFFMASYAATSQDLYWIFAFFIGLACLYGARLYPRTRVATTLVALSIVPFLLSFGENSIHIERGYFGVFQIAEKDNLRTLNHGTTQHGTQSLIEELKTIPLSYYYKMGPIGDAFRVMHRTTQKINVAGIGLGTGTIACLTKPKDNLSIIEIDPAIIRVSTTGKFFDFIDRCNPATRILQGDGRLLIKDFPDKSQDIVIVDAFSSDSIPLHLITTDAIKLYMNKLTPEGVLLLHISNRYFDLAPEIGSIAKKEKISALIRHQRGGVDQKSNLPYNASSWVALGHDQSILKKLQTENLDWKPIPGPFPFPPWTDQNSFPLRALKIELNQSSSPER